MLGFGVCDVSVSPNSHLCQSVLVVLFVKRLQPFVYTRKSNPAKSACNYFGQNSTNQLVDKVTLS